MTGLVTTRLKNAFRQLTMQAKALQNTTRRLLTAQYMMMHDVPTKISKTIEGL